MTLRKLAKALGIRPDHLSPERFERPTEAADRAPEKLSQGHLFDLEKAADYPVTNAMHDLHDFNEAILRVRESIRAINQTVEKPPPQRRNPDSVPRAEISERQLNILTTVFECGLESAAIVADRLDIDVMVAHHDLSVLEEHYLVFLDEYGLHISPLGRDLVEATVNTKGKLSLDEALRHIATLMNAYERVLRFAPHSSITENAAPFLRLQEMVMLANQHIVAAVEPAPGTQTIRK